VAGGSQTSTPQIHGRDWTAAGLSCGPRWNEARRASSAENRGDVVERGIRCTQKRYLPPVKFCGRTFCPGCDTTPAGRKSSRSSAFHCLWERMPEWRTGSVSIPSIWSLAASRTASGPVRAQRRRRKLADHDWPMLAGPTGVRRRGCAAPSRLARVFGTLFCAPATPDNRSFRRLTLNAAMRVELDRIIGACAGVKKTQARAAAEAAHATPGASFQGDALPPPKDAARSPCPA
jgi:hypothetical protein